MKHLIALGLLASICACQTPAPASADPPGGSLPGAAEDTCGARKLSAFIGKPITSPGVPPASREVRHVAPDSVITMDFSPQRLNIKTDKDGIIRQIQCG
jgi:hypothetical protein